MVATTDASVSAAAFTGGWLNVYFRTTAYHQPTNIRGAGSGRSVIVRFSAGGMLSTVTLTFAPPARGTLAAGVLYSSGSGGATFTAAGDSCSGTFKFDALSFSTTVVTTMGLEVDGTCGHGYLLLAGELALNLPNDGGNGYYLFRSDGSLTGFGNDSYLTYFGTLGDTRLNAPIVTMATTPTGGGYWMAASDGGIFAFGNAPFYGSMGGHPLNKPIVGMAATPTGHGYWEVASDGGIFAFGTAPFYGSMGGHPLNKPIVGISADAQTGGYWEVASDGGIFAFTAPFAGTYRVGANPFTTGTGLGTVGLVHT